MHRFVAPLVFGVAVSAGAQDSASLVDSRLCNKAMNQKLAPDKESITQEVAGASGARAFYLKGCLKYIDAKHHEAAQEFERAVRTEDANAVYHLWLGRALGEQAQRANPLKQAMLARRTHGEFSAAVARAPDYLDAREALYTYYVRAPGIMGGGVDKARKEVEEVARRNPYRGGFLRVNLAIQTRDTASAIATYQALVAQYSDSTAPRISLINLLGLQKKFAEAWEALDRLEQVRPTWLLSRYAAGSLASESGEQLDRGDKGLREYLAEPAQVGWPSHAAAHWRLGMIAERRGDSAAARQEFQAALAMDPNLKVAKDALGRVR